MFIYPTEVKCKGRDHTCPGGILKPAGSELAAEGYDIAA